MNDKERKAWILSARARIAYLKKNNERLEAELAELRDENEQMRKQLGMGSIEQV